MREITAFQSADGVMHLSEKAAIDSDENLLGQELDGLLKMFNLDISRRQEYNALLHVMKNRAELAKAMREILRIIDHSQNDN